MIKYFISGFFLVSLGFSVDVNFSLETKYGKDKSNYKYSENILDISTFHDNISFYSQLEYSDPPLLGISQNSFNNMKPIVYIDYMTDFLNLKIGNISTLFGRGTSLNLSQDQNSDFDNTVNGIILEYFYSNFNFTLLKGGNKFYSRTNPTQNSPDRFVDNELNFLGASYTYKSLLFGYGLKKQSINLDKDNLMIAMTFPGRNQFVNNILSLDGLVITDGEFVGLGSALLADQNLFTIDETVNQFIFNFMGNNSDLYIDMTFNNYDSFWNTLNEGNDALQGLLAVGSISNEKITGRNTYLAYSTYILNTGISLEYKNYDLPNYFLQTSASPPTLFKESNSILASRNPHKIDFLNETGLQFEINKPLSNGMKLIINYSVSSKHDLSNSKSFSELYNYDFDNHDLDEGTGLDPFRQIYTELNGWLFDDKFSYKIGLDIYDEIYFGNGPKFVSAVTIPIQFSYSLGNYNSFSSYIEYQNATSDDNKKNVATDEKIIKEIDAYYISTTYNFRGMFSTSIFIDVENSEENSNIKENEWLGFDLTCNLSTDSQISLFYGSQKGGLVCANGICAQQPEFNDGIKVTLRTIF
jgi:hypothetical protein